MAHEHHYRTAVEWTGNRGSGTKDYRGYGRDHVVTAAGKPPIAGSSDPAFRGDKARWNPEELLVASLAQCHMLWYLHLACEAGIIVTAYRDEAEGVMLETNDGGGRFARVVLRPRIALAPGSDPEQAKRLHHDAHEKCFIANSVNFPVACEPQIEAA